jgi:hypothetical protein
MSELGIYRRVAQAFDLAGITNVVGPRPLRSWRRAEVGNAGAKWV